MPHPAVQILVWVLLALLVQRLQGITLLVMCIVLLSLALKLFAVQMLSLLRRTRWIVLSLLLIYAYTTPGIALFSQLGMLSPTWEGLSDGTTQLGRLLSVLAGLAILLALLSQAQLISGLYSLMYPLRWLGLSRERFAVRLALTLENAESAMRDTAGDWRTSIGNALKPNTSGASHIEFDVHAFRLIDVLTLLACAALMIGVWR
ncbi:MAG: CbiQ family ECF transporter T component [Gallionella sp.]|nr:CbiQ family ECF transporter T component [Gallionella sp.]